MAKTNSGLVAYAKAQVGLPYWYGTYGQTASADLYTSKKNQYPSYYTASDFASQYGKRVHDCVGLIKGYIWSDNATSKPTYNSSQDKSAKGMYSASTEKGKISTFPGKAGQLVYKGSSASAIYHVGVYDGNGYVYQAQSHATGVVKTAYKSSDWTFWSQCPYITDDTTTTTASGTTTTATTEKKATEPAYNFDKSLAGTYKVTAQSGLVLRNGAGTSKTKMVTMPYGTKVKCYGYYNIASNVKWYYISVTLNSINYIGFCCSTYLSKV